MAEGHSHLTSTSGLKPWNHSAVYSALEYFFLHCSGRSFTTCYPGMLGSPVKAAKLSPFIVVGLTAWPFFSCSERHTLDWVNQDTYWSAYWAYTVTNSILAKWFIVLGNTVIQQGSHAQLFFKLFCADQLLFDSILINIMDRLDKSFERTFSAWQRDVLIPLVLLACPKVRPHTSDLDLMWNHGAVYSGSECFSQVLHLPPVTLECTRLLESWLLASANFISSNPMLKSFMKASTRFSLMLSRVSTTSHQPQDEPRQYITGISISVAHLFRSIFFLFFFSDLKSGEEMAGVPVLSTGLAYHLPTTRQVSHSPWSNFGILAFHTTSRQGLIWPEDARKSMIWKL